MKTLIIIPTYNEKDNIERLLNILLGLSPEIEVLVVDDGSPDLTGDIVHRLQDNEPRIHLIRRPGKMGLGSAYVTGFKYALAQDFQYIMEMDADFSHNPLDVPRLIEAAQKYDLVIGSRYCNGVNIVNWPIRRLLLSYFASKYVRVITKMPVKDPTGGFKCFNRKVLETIELEKILSDGYAFQVEINFRAWVKGFSIKEIPIIFTERINGVSKMSRRIAWEAAWMVWRLQIMKLLRLL
ncbi:MAG: polyprenol monophosphomannose synthase [Candidatus Cloacimonetes bacterium]|nr:polyprenol monophosphomannose synthase [Candidatus Cloacimonadota bacterium]